LRLRYIRTCDGDTEETVSGIRLLDAIVRYRIAQPLLDLTHVTFLHERDIITHFIPVAHPVLINRSCHYPSHNHRQA
jgi:hypothetical protein